VTHMRKHGTERLEERDLLRDGLHDSETSSGGPISDRRHWFALTAIIAAVGLVVLVIVLHLTGVLGPRAH
jgi:hypothetical protein